MAVNRSHELIPTATAMYAADTGFWMFYAAAREFKGRKFGPDASIQRVCPSVEIVKIQRDMGVLSHRMIREPAGTIGGGGNSAFQAVNLVAQWRPSRICLVGFDYCGAHWHPDHPVALRNPGPDQLDVWARTLDKAAPVLAAWGIEVLNLSPRSALRAYRRARLDERGELCLSPFA